MVKKRIFRVVFLLLLLGMSESCQQKSNEPTLEDMAYFPLQVGDYWVYQVMSEKYVSTNSSIKNVYQFEFLRSNYFRNWLRDPIKILSVRIFLNLGPKLLKQKL